MNNYVPKNEQNTWELISKNPLYEELFLYRAEAGCKSCENATNCNPTSGNVTCDDCFNNRENILSPDLSISRISAEKLTRPLRKIKNRGKLLSFIIGKGDCPLCSRKDWTGIMAAYFFDGAGNISFGEVESIFCPLCGKSIEDNEE